MYNFLKLSVRENRLYFAGKILLVIFFISIFASSLTAGEVILKNGKTIKGKIESKTKYTVIVINKKGIRQTIRMTRVKKIIEDVVEPEEPAGTSTVPPNYSMKLGLKTPFMLPVGELSTVLGPGFGATVYGVFPLYYISNQLIVTAGFDIGFINMAGAGDAANVTINMIPVLLYGGITFRTGIGLSPYVNVGTGVTAVMLTGDTTANDIPDGSSVDGTILAGIGTTYTHPALKGVEFILDVSYIMALEKVAGSFLSVSLGAAYRFDFGWSGFPSKRSGQKVPVKPEI